MPAHEPEYARAGRLRWIGIRVLGAVAIATALALLPYRAMDSESQAMLVRLEADIDAARHRLSVLDRENAILRREIAGLRDDGRAVEEFARRDLGMARPDELLIRFEVPR